MTCSQHGCVVYMLRCRDASLYTGWTNCMEKRLAAHSAGQGAKYTKTRRPVELVYLEPCATKTEALKREYQLKHLSRKEKLALIERQPFTASIQLKKETPEASAP